MSCIPVCRSDRYAKSFLAMGTANTIAIFTADGSRAETVLRQAFERVTEIEERMSAFKYDSDISRLNRNAGRRPQRIHPETFHLLKLAQHFSALSGGAFDVTIRPLTALWAFGQNDCRLPEQQQITRALRLVNYRDILLNEAGCTAFLKNEGQSVDLGGIAKGYAADEVKRILIRNGIDSAMINFGGNIVALGARPDGSPWRVGIQNPLAPRGQYIGTLPVTDRSIVTSGSNERFFVKDGVRYHHILDPASGYSAQSGLLSVTAVCRRSVEADALTTALFVLGPEKSAPLLESAGAEAVFIMENMDVYMTGSLFYKLEKEQVL